MNKEVRVALEADRRHRVLSYILSSKNVLSNCRDFGIPRSTFYRWRKAFLKEGKAGLFLKKPVAKSHPHQILPFSSQCWTCRNNSLLPQWTKSHSSVNHMI